MLPVVTVVGPTATGKTEVAQLVAQAIGGEVVSADSMQVYTGMNIGTAKLPESKRTVPYHLIDVVEPGQAFSVQRFQVLARAAFDEINERGNVALLCGGTGLYVQAALERMEFPSGEQTNNPVRAAYEAYAEEHGSRALWDVLNEQDAASAAVIHPHNTRRVVRALEMNEQGISYANQVKHIRSLAEVVPSIRFCLDCNTDVLAHRINARVDAMFADGLIEEVQGLLAAGFREALTAREAIGYKEIVAALDGKTTMEEAAEAIKVATRRYAKRQRSWFRRDSRLIHIDATQRSPQELAQFVIEQLQMRAIVGATCTC